MDEAGDAGLPADEAIAFEDEQHLVDGWRGDAEIALQVAFGRRAAVDLAIGPDESEILALFVGEAGRLGQLFGNGIQIHRHASAYRSRL